MFLPVDYALVGVRGLQGAALRVGRLHPGVAGLLRFRDDVFLGERGVAGPWARPLGNAIAHGHTGARRRGGHRPPVSSPASLSLAGGADPIVGDFDIERMNREYALVLLGSNAVVCREVPGADDNHRFITLPAFGSYFANQLVERRGQDGKVGYVTMAKAWMQHPDRRTFDGVEFYPGHPGEQGGPTRIGFLNLWKGFAVMPAEAPDARRYGPVGLRQGVAIKSQILAKCCFAYLDA
jgi:hypothetical protein